MKRDRFVQSTLVACVTKELGMIRKPTLLGIRKEVSEVSICVVDEAQTKHWPSSFRSLWSPYAKDGTPDHRIGLVRTPRR